MLSNKLLICIVLCYGSVDALKKCTKGPCLLIDECKETITSETINRSDVCGYKSVGGKTVFQICCSDFEVDTDKRFGPEEGSTEDHPNIALLPTECGIGDNTDRIIGGEFSGLYEFPWMALISKRIVTNEGKKSVRFVCGGTIINSRYILTAAHCVNDSNVAGVRVGEYNINAKEDCVQDVCESHLEDIAARKLIVHENYSGLNNDIALIRLKRNITFGFNNVKPICLPVYDNLRNINLSGKRGDVNGWGTTESFSSSPVPRKASITVKTADECASYYESSKKVFCAGEGGKDSCKGDSGGPFMFNEVYNSVYRTVQFGVVSAGDRQCGSGKPGLYTDVRKYVKWILDNIEA